MLLSKKQKISADLITGIDVGGTKVHVKDNVEGRVHHYATTDCPDMYAVLDDYFQKLPVRPRRIALAIAGPRDEHSGVVQMTNSSWPAFDPSEASMRYPGTTFVTYNDMVGVTAGIAAGTSTLATLLKPGVSSASGTKVAVSISTGVGAGVAVWNQPLGRHIYLETEAGHAGFQPYGPIQRAFLDYLFSQYPHPSYELALSGKFGIENWLTHLSDKFHAPELGAALKRADATGRPLGAVLLEFATQSRGEPQQVAHLVLDYMGQLAGNMLADLALVYKASGGIFLTGSLSMALAEYWAQNTAFTPSFIRTGTDGHAAWLEGYLSNLPIYLVTDPHVAVNGALELAKQG